MVCILHLSSEIHLFKVDNGCPIGEIPIEELTVLALDLLLKGVAREDLIVEEMRKYLGLKNLHPSTGKRLRRAVKLALEEGEK